MKKRVTKTRVPKRKAVYGKLSPRAREILDRLAITKQQPFKVYR